MPDFKEFVQKVKEANDIVGVISSYIDVRRNGQNHWARCPFHGEKTPSFSISQRGQFYHCFGCGESGDVVKFVEKFESVSFMEALEILAKRANIPMPEQAEKRSADLDAKKKKRDLYLAILRDTAVFYWRNFYAPQGKPARDYIYGRGFSEEVCKTFGIGFSPDTESLPRHLQSKGYDAEACLAAGVLQRSQKGRYFDALFGRLIVPIMNVNGKVIGFGGRALSEEQAQYGKYKNTAETEVFVKKSNLFAINAVKQQKQRGNLPYVVMVEGYMDVLSMFQAGFVRAVASMGTSLTVEQAKLVSRLTDTVYICYDGDAAGQKATIRGMDILAGEGLEVFVMSVPDNRDPDEYIKERGNAAFEKLIEEALPLADYKLKVLENTFPFQGATGATRNNLLAKYVRGALKVIAALDDVSQARYIEVISAKTGYSSEYLRRKAEKGGEVQAAEEGLPAKERALYFVAACMLADKPFAVLTEKPKSDRRFLENLFDYLFRCKSEGRAPSVDMMYTVCPDAEKEEYNLILQPLSSPSDKDEQTFADCAKLILASDLKEKRDALLAEMKNGGGDSEELFRRIEQLNEQIANLYE